MAKYSKRPDGFYRASVIIGRDAQGNYKRKYVYAKTIKELDLKRSEYERKVRLGLVTERENASFYEISQEWLQYKAAFVSERSAVRYKCVVMNHLTSLHPYRLLDLKATHLQMILNSMARDGFSRGTIAEVKQTASQILEYAMMNDILYRNVFQKIPIPKASKKPRVPLTKEQIALVRSTWSEHRMGIPALIMLYCGLRRGELIALTWRDVDLKKKALAVCKAATTTSNQHKLKDPKTAAGYRMVPIPDFLVDILAKQPRESLMVCPAATGEMMSAQAWERAWESYMHFLNLKAGGRDRSRINPKVVAMEPFTPHQLRHTYATLLYDAGVDAKSAQEMMGHSNIQTTLEIYTHLSREKKTTAISVFNDYLNSLDTCNGNEPDGASPLPIYEDKFEVVCSK